jgi:hypothetical protein
MIMKKYLYMTLFCILTLSVFIAAGDVFAAVKIGDLEDDVIYELDEPNAKLTLNGELTYYYDAGTVVFKDGAVTKIKMMSEAETDALMAKKAAAKAARAEAARAASAERLRKGTLEKKQKMSDEAFKNKKPKEKLDYWLNFKKTYPEVPVQDQIDALEKVAGKKEEKSDKVVGIEARIQAKQDEKKVLQGKSGMSRSGRLVWKQDLARLTREIAALRKELKDEKERAD